MTQAISEIVLHPDLDGVNHCNFYSRAKTPLGRLGSNLADRAILHPVYGPFRTLEGLWCFLRTGCEDNTFRVISGFDAKKRSKTVSKAWNINFKEEFKLGILAKVREHTDIRVMLIDGQLPLVHYYFYGSPDKGGVKVVVPKGHEWQMAYWEYLRAELRKNRTFESLEEELISSLKPNP